MGWVGVEMEWTIDQDVKRQKLRAMSWLLDLLIFGVLSRHQSNLFIFESYNGLELLTGVTEDQLRHVQKMNIIQLKLSEIGHAHGENFWKFHPD